MNIEELKALDPTFSESMFLTKVNNIFIKLFTNIMMDKLVEVRHFISDDVYNYANNIIEEAKKNNARQMYDELNIKETTIKDVSKQDGYYQINVVIHSRYLSYRISLDDGSFISGDNNNRINVFYYLTFKKKIDAKDQSIVRQCPNCGASLQTNNSGQCPFCHSIYNQEDYDWVLTSISS